MPERNDRKSFARADDALALRRERERLNARLAAPEVKVKSYCVDFAPTDEPKRVLMTGCHSVSVATSLHEAMSVATDARGYAHHARLTLTVYALCATCGGSGKTHLRRARLFSERPCKACKEVGQWPVAEARVVNRSPSGGLDGHDGMCTCFPCACERNKPTC